MKCSLWRKKILNAQGWDNGKIGGGKQSRAFYLGLPCTSFIPGVQLLPSPASLNREKSFKVAWTKRRKSQFLCWEINVMFRQPQDPAITLVVSHFPQYSHIPYHKKPQIPYLNTVIKLPTSNDSWDRAASHLWKRLIQREQISAPKIILKIHPGCSYLGWHPLNLSYIPLGHPKSAFSGLYLPYTYKEMPCSPRLSSVQPK